MVLVPANNASAPVPANTSGGFLSSLLTGVRGAMDWLTGGSGGVSTVANTGAFSNTWGATPNLNPINNAAWSFRNLSTPGMVGGWLSSVFGGSGASAPGVGGLSERASSLVQFAHQAALEAMSMGQVKRGNGETMNVTVTLKLNPQDGSVKSFRVLSGFPSEMSSDAARAKAYIRKVNKARARLPKQTREPSAASMMNSAVKQAIAGGFITNTLAGRRGPTVINQE